jgi:hypothetical protein
MQRHLRSSHNRLTRQIEGSTSTRKPNLGKLGPEI